MGKETNRGLIAYLPLVFLATFLVVVGPLLLVFWLRTTGVVTSVWVGMAVGVSVSFLTSYAGAAFWKTRTDSRDLLFNELMLWGWVQRWRGERRLNAAADLLGLTTGRPQEISGGDLTNEQKTGLLTQLTSGLEARDPYTHGHSRRVARHASTIAKRLGMARAEVAKIRAAGAMHDVGKVDTPMAVLQKEGKLTDEEYAIIKRHPVDGATMVATLHDDELTAIVRHHHERLDGTGYPDGLTGEDIPIGARIIAVADTFDAITSTRPYRHARAHKKALDILAAEAGTQLDPDAVRAFCACYSGRRPLAYWTILLHGRPRLASLLGGGVTSAKTAAVNVMASAGTAAALGGAALGPIVEGPPGPSPVAADTAAASAADIRSSPPASPKSGRATQGTRWGGPRSPRATGDRNGRRRNRSSSLAPSASAPARSVAVGADQQGGVPVIPPVQAVSVSPAPAQAVSAPIDSGQVIGKPERSARGEDKVERRGKLKRKVKDKGKSKGKRDLRGKGRARPRRNGKSKPNGKPKENGRPNRNGKPNSKRKNPVTRPNPGKGRGKGNGKGPARENDGGEAAPVPGGTRGTDDGDNPSNPR